jgi:hypothetical protein
MNVIEPSKRAICQEKKVRNEEEKNEEKIKQKIAKSQ